MKRRKTIGGIEMKVVAFNGSPHKAGNTYQAIQMVAAELEKEGIEVEVVQVGSEVVRGCIACNQCAKNKDEKCILKDDSVNDWIQKMKSADGIILASPVHYASISATMKAFLDRSFYVASGNGGMLRHKVGASLVAVRRSGGVPAFSQLNNYINYSEMVMPTSRYWNVIHGAAPGEVQQDEEGVQIMRVLGKNMAWVMTHMRDDSAVADAPAAEAKARTNFIR
jgi:multimeric flavodoxin WrbA